jgi:uncharacterized membrane protein YfhO
VVKYPPENGIDVVELRPFVAALDNSSLPVASTVWPDVNDAQIRAQMSAGQVISVATNYHSGWTATANGKSAPVRADGLGLIVIQPDCSGDCAVNLHWSPGPEPWICLAISITAMAGALVWWRRGRYPA